jgi:gas vesicle protein GvpO
MPEERVSAQDDRSGGQVKPHGGRNERGRGQAAARHEKIGRRAAEQELDRDDDQAQGQQDRPADHGQDGHGQTPGRDTSQSGTSRREGAEGDGPVVRRGAAEDQGDQGDQGDETDDHDRQEPAIGQFPPDHLSAKDAANAGMRGLADVIGNQVVGVTEVSPRHDGWIVAVEVLELQRLPSSADIMALYEAELDMDGTLRSYRRTKRYTRGHGDSGDH